MARAGAAACPQPNQAAPKNPRNNAMVPAPRCERSSTWTRAVPTLSIIVTRLYRF
jgi:hypothetical protein